MTKNYTKPIVTIDSGMAEGVYAASGATKGTLNVTYYGVSSGKLRRYIDLKNFSDPFKVLKGLAQASWSDLDGTITLNINFNDTVDSIETDDASVQKSWSGKTATLTFASTATNPLTIGIHLNHGTSIDDLQLTGFDYSVN